MKRTLTALSLSALFACGPARPVLLYVPPSITLDPFGAARRTGDVFSQSTSFWQAMSSLDTGYVRRQSVNDTQRAFSDAIGLVMAGHHEDAALALDGIRATSKDTLIAAVSRILMTAMLQYEDKWKLLAELDSLTPHRSRRDHDKAGVETWATAFRAVAAREMSFPSKPVVLPLLLSPSGAPMIPVMINGKEHTFWLDTGSSMSMVSTKVALECGVSPLIPDTLEVVTTTGRVPAQAGAISRLSLGGIKVENSTALIVANERMQVRVGSESGAPMVTQIDGVVGYDLIRRMNVRIDYVNRRVTLMKPDVNAQLPRTGRNLFWVGTPVVRLVTAKGVPLHFNLDTGAQESYSTDALLTKTKVRTFSGERRLVGGLAGLAIVHGRFVDELRATMGGRPLLFRKLLVFAPSFSTFVSVDGVLGSDIGRGGVVRIDATNGIFLLEPEGSSQGLREGG